MILHIRKKLKLNMHIPTNKYLDNFIHTEIVYQELRLVVGQVFSRETFQLGRLIVLQTWHLSLCLCKIYSKYL